MLHLSRSGKRTMNLFATTLFLTSAALVALNAAGRWLPALLDRTTQRSLGAFIDSLGDIEQVGEEQWFINLSRRVTSRFSHALGRHSLWSNYLCWAASPWVPWLGVIEDTSALFRYSRVAFCHQVAQAFVDVATRMGRQARVVDLHGHVLAEAYYGGKWHAFDPDYGVIFSHAGDILSLDELAADPDLAAALYAPHRFQKSTAEVLAIVRRNDFARLSPGQHLSADKARRQRLLEWAKWLLPMAGMVAATGAIVFEG
jgi:hypothetical protein